MHVKLLVLNPVGVEIWNNLVLEHAVTVLSSDVEVVVRHITSAPPYIETEYEKELAAPLVVREVVRANEEGFSGVVINCFDDPGLEASREISEIPVFGIGETSLYAAMLLGDRVAVISTGKDEASLRRWISSYRRRLLQLGIERRVVYVTGILVPILDLRKNIEAVVTALLEETIRAVREHNVDVAVLGCGGFIGLADKLSEKAGVPVIDPTVVTLKVAEAFLKLGLRHRRVKPPYT